jgi:uncharacterized membrane protein YciS (DUF1049 family)
MAVSAAVEAGYPSPYISDTSVPTSTIVAVIVGTALVVGLLVAGIMLFIQRRRQNNRHEEGIEMQLMGMSAPPA